MSPLPTEMNKEQRIYPSLLPVSSTEKADQKTKPQGPL